MKPHSREDGAPESTMTLRRSAPAPALIFGSKRPLAHARSLGAGQRRAGSLTSYVLGPAETQTREQHRQGVTPEAKTLHLGCRNVFVAVGRDISQRTLRAWRAAG